MFHPFAHGYRCRAIWYGNVSVPIVESPGPNNPGTRSIDHGVSADIARSLLVAGLTLWHVSMASMGGHGTDPYGMECARVAVPDVEAHRKLLTLLFLVIAYANVIPRRALGAKEYTAYGSGPAGMLPKD
jgi:hypothetical protein